MVDREVADKEKAQQLYWFGVFALKFKYIRGFLKEFLSQLDYKEIHLSKDDYYFCLRKSAYNFKGHTLSERLEEAAGIDAMTWNIILNI